MVSQRTRKFELPPLHALRLINRPKESVTMGEPCLGNPNFYANVEEFLKDIQDLSFPHCSWCVVGSDGVLSQRLHDAKNKFKIILLPGQGHIAMNVVRALLKLLWPFGMGDLAKILGFRTQTALAYANKAADFHKAWKRLIIFSQAPVKSLVESSESKMRSSGCRCGALSYILKYNTPSLQVRGLINLRYVLVYRRCRQGTRSGCSL